MRGARHIIEAQAGASAAALRVAEEHAARLAEQPEWILSEVLSSRRTWEAAVAPTAVARNQPRVPVLDGKLYVVGGYDGDTGNASSSVERAVRPRDQCVGGGGADGDGARISRRGSA